eukprot:363721_1
MKPSTRKFHNTFGCSVYGLHLSMVQKYFQNNKNHYEFGKFIKSQKCVTNLIKCNNSYIADVKDCNNNQMINTVIISLFQEPVKSELDIHPTETVCNCTTYKMEIQKKSKSEVKEIMCPDIAAVLLCLIDGGDTTSPFITAASFTIKKLNHNNQFRINSLVFNTADLHHLCPHPSKIWDDLSIASVILTHKKTATLILAYATCIRTKAPYCIFCKAAASPDMKELAFVHKCPMHNPTNINAYTNRSTSFFTFSIMFKDISVPKFMQIMLLLAQYEYEPFCKLARTSKEYTAQLISLTFHRVSTVCDIVMDNSKQFGRKEHSNIEADGGKCGRIYHGKIQNAYAYEQSWHQTTINRDVTHKGQKPMISEMGGVESIKSYGSHMKKTWAHGANLYTDEHTLYTSNFTRNRWRQSGCRHKEKQWRDPDTKHLPACLKGHDNNAEQIMNIFKIQRRIRKGMGLVNNGEDAQRKNWFRIMNWKKSFTNGTPKDFLVTFFQHCSLLLEWQMPCILADYQWEENTCCFLDWTTFA